MNVTVRKIYNGYVVVLPPTPGTAPAMNGQREIYKADLTGVNDLLSLHFEPPEEEAQS